MSIKQIAHANNHCISIEVNESKPRGPFIRVKLDYAFVVEAAPIFDALFANFGIYQTHTYLTNWLRKHIKTAVGARSLELGSRGMMRHASPELYGYSVHEVLASLRCLRVEELGVIETGYAYYAEDTLTGAPLLAARGVDSGD